ncbi:MAG TPA: hypothetical protein VGC67_04345 [Cellulomonas sp.]
MNIPVPSPLGYVIDDAVRVAHLLRVIGSEATVLERTSMVDVSLSETEHLEGWIKAHPEIIDDSLKVVTTQFGSWASLTGVAHERPDVLALSTSGEIVVIELKRAGDRRVHLQALTYGALAAGFSKELLAQAHSEWLAKEHGESVSVEEALDRLTTHVESEWTEDLFRLPRLVLVAESFPAQVLTTVQWLSSVASDLTIECHEYQVFRDVDRLYASFQQLYPVDTLEDRQLRPVLSSGTAEVRERVVTNRRRTKSVTIVADAEAIPEGARLTLELDTLVKPAVIAQVRDWLAGDPDRENVTWTNHPTRPLLWAADSSHTWTPSALRNEIFARAGVPPHSFSAADAWCYEGENLYVIASRVVEDGEDL